VRAALVLAGPVLVASALALGAAMLAGVIVVLLWLRDA
jgi:hypothetical protein